MTRSWTVPRNIGQFGSLKASGFLKHYGCYALLVLHSDPLGGGLGRLKGGLRGRYSNLPLFLAD